MVVKLESMITRELWIANLVDDAIAISNKEQQELRWLAPDAQTWERPEELFNDLFDAHVFEGFIEEFNSTFSNDQRSAAFALRDGLNRYGDATQKWLDPSEVLADPRWEAIRRDAARFIDAFKDKWPPSSE